MGHARRDDTVSGTRYQVRKHQGSRYYVAAHNTGALHCCGDSDAMRLLAPLSVMRLCTYLSFFPQPLVRLYGAHAVYQQPSSRRARNASHVPSGSNAPQTFCGRLGPCSTASSCTTANWNMPQS